MIPISSSKLNSKLGNNPMGRSLLNEGRSSKKACLYLLMGVIIGICLAGFFFYSIQPSEVNQINSKDIIRIIGLGAAKNDTHNSTLSVIDPAKNLVNNNNTSTDNNKTKVQTEELEKKKKT